MVDHHPPADLLQLLRQRQHLERLREQQQRLRLLLTDAGAPKGAPFYDGTYIVGTISLRMTGTNIVQQIGGNPVKNGDFLRVRIGETDGSFSVDICGHTHDFCEISVKKDKEKFQKVLDILSG